MLVKYHRRDGENTCVLFQVNELYVVLGTLTFFFLFITAVPATTMCMCDTECFTCARKFTYTPIHTLMHLLGYLYLDILFFECSV